MKKTLLTLVLSLIGLFTFAQDSTTTTTTSNYNSSSFQIKDYSLRDYIAPDIKYRSLMVGSHLDGGGGQAGNFNSNMVNGNANIRLYSYRNLQGYQGYTNTGITANYTGEIRNLDTNGVISQSAPSFGVTHSSTNRWYNSNDRFIGVHPSVMANYYYSANNRDIDTLNPSFNNSQQNANLFVVMSVGSGRIQPVTAARRAMDILISLEKYNRLAKNPTNEQIDSLAKVANRITYKRFYDPRYKRIYQLAELDSGIQSMELVDDPDMIYAANLSDIWNYGTTYSRGSGSRFELGVIPTFQYSNNERNGGVNDYRRMNSMYGVSGFASWVKKLPINYQWQSDFSVLGSYGYAEKNIETFDIYDPDESSQINTESISVNWNVGYFPNTRTWVRMSPFLRFSAMQNSNAYNNQNPIDEDYVGMSTGIELRAYYYVSPRFRLGFEGGTTFTSDGFVDVTADGRISTIDGRYFYTNNETNLSGRNLFHYNYQFTLSYAIF